MITRAEVEKLGAVHTVAPAILSVYLTVPSVSYTHLTLPTTERV